jgi:hypothetical protein
VVRVGAGASALHPCGLVPTPDNASIDTPLSSPPLHRPGVEICGALKNVLAIAAGIVEGLDLGHNALAALVAQGCAEIRWLAEKLGAKPQTMSGLSGLGDIMLTCYGDLSRNRSVGMRLGRGEKLEEILASSSQVRRPTVGGPHRTSPDCTLASVKCTTDPPPALSHPRPKRRRRPTGCRGRGHGGRRRQPGAPLPREPARPHGRGSGAG